MPTTPYGTYIQMNFDGLKDDIIRMLSGERVYVNTLKFQNDMHIVRSRNDVLTVLIHLGYLAHDEQTSILSYNDENSLACVLSMAYIWARNEYIIHREYATGKGYADLVMIPRRNVSKPALVIELKFNQSADTAIDQIKRKEYPSKIAEYTGDILLVGINYDKETKQHTCKIERMAK